MSDATSPHPPLSDSRDGATSAERLTPLEPFNGDMPQLGREVFVHPSAAVIGKVTLGDRVSIWPQVTLRADEGEIRIGDDTNIQDGSVVHMTGGYSETMIGSRVTVGHMCLLHGCKVGDDCLIGMGTILLDRCEIGEGSYIAAGTMITGGKVIPPRSFVMGRPGSLVIKPLPPQRAQERDYSWRHYVEVGRTYLKRQLGGSLSVLLLGFTASLSGLTSGCAPSERPYQSPSASVRQHHISFSTLKQQNLYDYSLFADTDLDLFSHRREVIDRAQRAPLTIDYKSFSSPQVDHLIERAQSLYAQYRFASHATGQFRAELVRLYGEDILNTSFESLRVTLNRVSSELDPDSGRGSEGDREVETPLEGEADAENPTETPAAPQPLPSLALIQRAKATRLSIAGHQDLVARASQVLEELSAWERLAEEDAARDINLVNVRPLIAREVERARESLDALMSGAPLLSKSMREVSAAAAAMQ